MKLLQGIRLSFRVQQIVQGDPVIVRGSRVVNEGEPPSAMNGYLYSIMKNTKTQRRGILMSLLKQFDESSVRNFFTKLFIKGVSVYKSHVVFVVIHEIWKKTQYSFFHKSQQKQHTVH